MNALNLGVNGILFCINDSGVMEGLNYGCGDMPEALLVNQDLSIVVSSIMNKKFIYGKVSNTKQENLARKCYTTC